MKMAFDFGIEMACFWMVNAVIGMLVALGVYGVSWLRGVCLS